MARFRNITLMIRVHAKPNSPLSLPLPPVRTNRSSNIYNTASLWFTTVPVKAVGCIKQHKRCDRAVSFCTCCLRQGLQCPGYKEVDGFLFRAETGTTRSLESRRRATDSVRKAESVSGPREMAELVKPLTSVAFLTRSSALCPDVSDIVATP